MPTRLPYREGDAFAVPLDDGSFVVGVVARMDAKGVVLGYFFGNRHTAIPGLADLEKLNAIDNAYVAIFGDLGLLRSEWPVIGALGDWRREEWPMPIFGRFEELTGRYFSVEYLDDDPNGRPRETLISEEKFDHLPQDGMAGYLFIKNRLTRLLGHST